MARDYKPAPQKKKPASSGSPFLSGVLVGVLLGIGASVSVVLLVRDSGSAFVAKSATSGTSSAPAETAKADNNAKPAAEAASPVNTKPVKPRFDFYTILPGSEKQVTEQEIKQAQTAKSETEQISGDNYFLQVGAFQTEQEADNMKAKLSLLGLEVVIQTATIPDKGVWHRVRVGPFSQIEEINKARTLLVKNSIDSTLLKIHSSTPNQ